MTATPMVAFLRGINVGGRAKLAMADLRAVVEGAGMEQVATYIQSGNLVFLAPADEPDRIAERLEAAIASGTDVTPRVMVRSGSEVEALLAANPFVDRTDDATQLHVIMHREPVTIDRDLAPFAPDEVAVVDRDVFLYLPRGMSGSKLVPLLARNETRDGTARNWRTMTRVQAMVSALPL